MNPKALDQSDLDAIFGDYPWKTRPMLHQLQTLAWCMSSPDLDRPMLWHAIGVGKSLTSLYAMDLYGCERILVVCPNSVVRGWAEQIPEHTDWPFVLLQGAKDDRRDLLDQEARVFVVNYTGLLSLFVDRRPVDPKKLAKRKGGPKTEAVINYRAIEDAGFDGIIIDECHHISNPNALTTRICRELSKRADHCIAMTGSPISTGEENLFGEYDVLDQGATFPGASVHSFHRAHFHRISFGGKGGKWVVTDAGRQRILQRIAPVTICYKRDGCFDLPPLVYQQRWVSPTRTQQKTSNDIAEGIRVKLDAGEIRPKGALQQAGKLAQVAGGFVLDDDGQAERFKKNPKLDELSNVLDEIDGKVIIYHQFVEEGRMIEKLLDRRSISYASFRSEIPKARQDAGYWRFKKTPNCRVLVAHPRSGGEGLNLQVASVVVWYSRPWVPKDRDQGIGRIWRHGQERPCLCVDILMEGSVDERIWRVLGERTDMVDGVVDYIRKG